MCACHPSPWKGVWGRKRQIQAGRITFAPILSSGPKYTAVSSLTVGLRVTVGLPASLRAKIAIRIIGNGMAAGGCHIMGF